MKYQFSGGGLLRDDGSLVPIDENNADYLEYKVWAGKGNRAGPEAEIVREKLVTADALKAALIKKGVIAETDVKQEAIRIV